MPIPETAYLSEKEQEQCKQNILNRLARGREYWRPLHKRQDYWHAMYRLEDVVQILKPPGYRRFVSNEPRTAVDLGVSLLTRNEAYWRIALFESMSENAEDRRMIGKIERTLQGIIHDIDEQFSQRLKMRLWKQVAFSALLRGYIWGKVHVTTEALKYRDTPIVSEIYDPRLVYPHIDGFGLNYVIIETLTTIGDLCNMYPEAYGDKEYGSNYDPNKPAIKIEYWSNDRGEKKGICAVLASEMPHESAIAFDAGYPSQGYASQWVIKPYYHGYTPTSLPVVGVPVNGVNLLHQPPLGSLATDRLEARSQMLGVPTSYDWTHGANTHVAESGRSILAAVEEHVPQYNELIATIMHHLGLSAYGTWVFTTPTGEMPNFSPGIESKIALTPEERLDRVQMGAMSQDAHHLVNILGDERQNGMLANILRANTTFEGTGVLFQQMANAALNAVEPYSDGMEEFGMRMGSSILAQLQEASSIIKPFEVQTPRSAGAAKNQSLWVVEFDPKELAAKKKRYRPRPVFRPSLPDDLAVRINAARMALDPRRPILSLTTVLEHILQVEDPTDEIDRIWEDIANTDPVLVFEQIAAALERMGESEMAERIKEQQFRTKFIEELEFKQASGAEIPAPQRGGAGPGPGMAPEAGAMTPTNEDVYGAAPGPPPMGMGAMGMRDEV